MGAQASRSLAPSQKTTDSATNRRSDTFTTTTAAAAAGIYSQPSDNNNCAAEAAAAEYRASVQAQQAAITCAIPAAAVQIVTPPTSLHHQLSVVSSCNSVNSADSNNSSNSNCANQIIIKIQYTKMENEQCPEIVVLEGGSRGRGAQDSRQRHAACLVERDSSCHHMGQTVELNLSGVAAAATTTTSAVPTTTTTTTTTTATTALAATTGPSVVAAPTTAEAVEYCEVLEELAAVPQEATTTTTTSSTGAIPKKMERKSAHSGNGITLTTPPSAKSVKRSGAGTKSQGVFRSALNRLWEPSSSSSSSSAAAKAHKHKNESGGSSKSGNNSDSSGSGSGKHSKHQENSAAARLRSQNTRTATLPQPPLPCRSSMPPVRPTPVAVSANAGRPISIGNMLPTMPPVYSNISSSRSSNNNNNGQHDQLMMNSRLSNTINTQAHGNAAIDNANQFLPSFLVIRHIGLLDVGGVGNVGALEQLPETVVRLIEMAGLPVSVTAVGAAVAQSDGNVATMAHARSSTMTPVPVGTTKPLPPLPLPPNNGPIVHSQVDFVHNLVPDLSKIFNASYYWGKMDRYEAERLLEGKPEGTFLLRDSAQDEFLFSVTFRKYGRSLHARIEQSGHKFSFDCHDPGVFTSATVTGLLDHYKDPSCVMFFEPMLTIPLHRKTTFSLQDLCRASIVSNISYDGVNRLELPMALKSYLKEYHYKQKLRVKPFDIFFSCT